MTEENKKRQENETIKDWLKRTSIKDDSWLKKAKHRQSVVRSADVNIVDSDIATIEVLHDLLLDAHGYSLDSVPLKRARELTAKMYKAISDSKLLKG